MHSAHIQTLGFVAGSLTTLAFIPQVLHTWRTGGKDLAWSMLSMFGSGVLLWIAYGFLVAAPPIIVANGLTIVQIAAIAVIKASHPRSRREPAAPRWSPSEHAPANRLAAADREPVGLP